jgi:PIN domain nuclease of toxin-antitoxin system
MNLLLDTHVLLWIVAGSRRLSDRAHSAIENGRNTVFVSAATAWEIAIKKSLGKLKAPPDYLDALKHYRFLPLDITSEHALAVEGLPRHHGDPFDRLLVSQARLEGLVLVTGDERLRKYDVKVLAA